MFMHMSQLSLLNFVDQNNPITYVKKTPTDIHKTNLQ